MKERKTGQSPENYRTLFENSKEVVFIAGPDGRLLDINPAGVELAGYASREEMLRINIATDLYANPAAREVLLRKLSETGYVKDFRLELKRKDGTRRTLLATITVIRDDNGGIAAHQGILHDITERIRAEKALAESEERLKLTLDAAHFVAWEIRVDGSHHEVGPVHELFGRPEGVRHPGLSDLFENIHPEDREGFRSMVESALRGEREYHIEFRVPRQDGTMRWIEAVGTLQRDARGEPARILGMSHDITKRKLAEEGLRRSENRVRSIINALPMGMHLYHLEGVDRLVFHGANPAADKILGVDHGNLIGKTIEEAFPALTGTEVPARYRETAGEGKPWRSEQVEYHDGAIQGAYEVHAFQTLPGSVAAVFRDITERKRMEEALRENEDRFKQLVRNSNDIIALISENGIYTSLSGPLEKILGYSPEELTGTSAYGFVHPDDAGIIDSMFPELIRNPGSSITVECRLQHKNGKWVSVEAVGTNLLHEPAVKSIVSNIRDITERNKLREQLQQAMKMEAVGRLAGGIAHDFNNILTVISGNVELARMSLSPSDPLNRSLDQVSKASDSAASLTRRLLAFSRKQIIAPKVLSLNELVLNVRQMLGRLIGENVELRISLQDGLGSVKVDPGQFEQVLVNLAVNASDAMPEGGKLTIETANVSLGERYCAAHPYAQPGDYVLLSMSDTGQGMSDKVKAHLFEPFFTTKSTGHGTGLGLATTFGAVKQAGGTIEVDSEAGRGTTFKIYLPLEEQRAEKLTRESLSPDKLNGGETILLVEDEESVRRVAMILLNGLGYRMIEARDGEEALMLAEKQGGRIDLLITDIVMPGMNGRELSETLTGLYPSVKTLFTSGYTEDVIVRHGVSNSHLNFIGKPYSLQDMARKIREVLDPGRPAAG